MKRVVIVFDPETMFARYTDPNGVTHNIDGFLLLVHAHDGSDCGVDGLALGDIHALTACRNMVLEGDQWQEEKP